MDAMLKIRRQQLEGIFPNVRISHEQVLKELPIYCGLVLIGRATAYRNQDDKFYINESEYPIDNFPPYCVGPFYSMPIKTASELLVQSTHIPYIWLQDVVVPGVLRLMMQTEKGILLSKSQKRIGKFSFGICGPVIHTPVDHIAHNMVERVMRRRWLTVKEKLQTCYGRLNHC